MRKYVDLFALGLLLAGAAAVSEARSFIVFESNSPTSLRVIDRAGRAVTLCSLMSNLVIARQ